MTDNSATPRGYRVHTNTWTAYGPQMPVDEVFDVLDSTVVGRGLQQDPKEQLMSAEVIIPDEAKSAGWEALLDARSENRELVQAYARALHAAAPLIVAAELDRLIADPNSYDDAGNFRAVVLVNRLRELRRAGGQS